MIAELLINVTGDEFRTAVVEDGDPVDLIVEREGRSSMAGNIYLGRVARLMPGMQAAFVDLGTDRDGFLPLSRPDDGQSAVDPTEGETVCVQVVRDPIGRKGAQLSRNLSLAGRHLVFTPERERIAVSRLIKDEDERARLTDLASSLARPGEGFILRTAAEGVGEADLAADAEHLRALWSEIEPARDQAEAPSLLHSDLGPLQRILRDFGAAGRDAIRIDDARALEAAREYCERYMPDAASALVLHDGPAPLFEMHDVEAVVEGAMDRRVALASGAGIVIESTEALTAVDVNSGSFTGGSGPEDNALLTNLDAEPEIARQLRLRNIGGMIVIDFIHMEQDESWDKVLDALSSGLARDRMPVRLIGLTGAGLVEITRRRRRQSLVQTLTAPCTRCGGDGFIKTLETVGFDVLRALRQEAAHGAPGGLVVSAGEGLISHLEDGAEDAIGELEQASGRTVEFRVETGYDRDGFDILID